MQIDLCTFTETIKSLLLLPIYFALVLYKRLKSLNLSWLLNGFDCTGCTPQSFTTASQASTKFVLLTFFGFSSFLFSHPTPTLCHQSNVRRSIASSSESNLQSLETSSSPRHSASSEITGGDSDSTSDSLQADKSSLPSNSSKTSKSIRLSPAGPTSTSISTTFPPILTTRFMHFIMQTSLLSRLVGAHIGEPCNSVFKICLPPSPHIYCDDNLICRCRDDYPVEILPHTCKLPRKIGDRCSHVKECTYLDPNAFCTKGYSSSECQCRDGFIFSYTDEKCVQGKASKSKPRTSEKLFLPSSIVFFLGCFGLICCTLLVWYIFCQSPSSGLHANSPYPPVFDSQLDPLNPSSRAGRTNTGRPDGGGGRSNGISRYNRSGRVCMSSRTGSIDSAGLRGSLDSSLRPHQLPSYDVAVFNQPPPSYDEAVKDTASAPACDLERVNLISNQMADPMVDQTLNSSSIVRSSGMISLTLTNNCINSTVSPTAPLYPPAAPSQPLSHSFASGQSVVSTGNIDRSCDNSQPAPSIQAQMNNASNTESTCITLPTSRI